MGKYVSMILYDIVWLCMLYYGGVFNLVWVSMTLYDWAWSSMNEFDLTSMNYIYIYYECVWSSMKEHDLIWMSMI